MERFDDLTQTQDVAVSQMTRPTVDNDVKARLISLIQAGESFDIRRDTVELEIGRHPDCRIRTDDKRASGKHIRIYRDENFHYFVEELSANGAWCNDHHMQKGDTRALQNGDAISICVHHQEKKEGQEPFAAYIFRLVDAPKEEVAQPAAAAAAAAGNMAAPASSEVPRKGIATSPHFVTEQWVSENWDMRLFLGQGNFSEVRLGVQVKKPGSERCAVKVIEKKAFNKFQSKRESHLSLQSEADMLMSLKHPGIIRFFEWFETEEKLFIAMEYLAGGDLLQYILDNAPDTFSEAVARRLFGEIGAAVDYLHSSNVVHRDLKPENILLTSKDVRTMKPKLADFGLARNGGTLKGCKTFCGTPHYFAPEVIDTYRQRDQGQEADYGKQADMWSLGVILYIMLCGVPPFEEDGLYDQILAGKYEFDVPEWNQVSPEAKELVRSLMEVNPRARLTIKQAMAHKWYNVGLSPPTPPEQKVIQQKINRPHPTEEETRAKRHRTMSDVGGAAGLPQAGA